MTIQFNCPNCNAVIGFEDKYCGKHAQCTTCGQRFIIPSKSFEKAEIVEQQKEKTEPEPGFYRAVFVDSWKLFVRPDNAMGLVFVTAAVCFKFFLGHVDYSWTVGNFRFQAPLGLVISLAAWGCLFWYYMKIICSTAIDIEELPDVCMGGFFGFIWNTVKSLFIFAFVFVAVELPCIIFIAVSGKENIFSNILSLAGLFIFPIAILTVTVVGDITRIFRSDYILKPITKAFCPYLVTVGLFVFAWQLQLLTVGYGQLIGSDKLVIGLHFCANLAVQALAIISMRSIGLFYQHYSCYFLW
jgi:hypothetical protein